MFAVKWNWRDGAVVAIVLAISLLLIWSPWQEQGKGNSLIISTPSRTVEYSLLENREISITEGNFSLNIKIENGEAFVSHSTCQDGICLASGRISHYGEAILCAPAGVRLYVKGGDGDVDFVAG